jgi:hypothetical protein
MVACDCNWQRCTSLAPAELGVGKLGASRWPPREVGTFVTPPAKLVWNEQSTRERPPTTRMLEIAKNTDNSSDLRVRRAASSSGNALCDLSEVRVSIKRVSRARRVVGDTLLSVGALILLLLVLVAVDGRVREEIAFRIRSAPSVQLTSVGAQARSLTKVISDAAREQSLEHGPLLLFAFAGTVLVLFMLRT